jgi:hypothetical protein
VRPIQLWLTVSEDHRYAVWPPTLADQHLRVALTPSVTIQGCTVDAPYRTSPVFPATAGFLSPKLAGETVYFCFLCFDPAFPVLGRLLENAPREITSGLLFSLGLASILYLGKDLKDLVPIEQIAGKPRAKEIWTVTDGRILSVTCECPQPVQFDPAALTIRAYEALPASSRIAIDEFVSSIALVVPKLAIHMPSELSTFLTLIGRVDELVGEMVYASNPAGTPPDTLSEYVAADFQRDEALTETILHQNADRIIQINAALSYLTTQALSGAVPILERRSLIRRYSLLGIGTAILALTRIARSIEDALAAGALETILADRGAEASALPGLDQLPFYDATDWPLYAVDRFEGKVTPREPYPKLPYFSGRLGFREGEYTISAALQSIAAGAGPEWSLLTLTHEMLHGHVRNILSIVLQADASIRPALKWQEFYNRYSARMSGAPRAPEGLNDSLRTILFAYCCLTLTHGSLTRESDVRRRPDGIEVAADFWLPKEAALWLTLERELRNISEILVHVFDLHYFYRSSLTVYLPLIWRSWSPLPQVKGDLRQYLLRSLLVAASKAKGTAYERFRASRLRLIELLDPLSTGGSPGTTTVKAAVALLSSDEEAEKMFYPFQASLILVDVADKVLTSKVIRGSLNSGDTHVSFTPEPASFEEWFEYDFPEGFVDDRVVAPTAYLADRLARRSRQSESTLLEHDTVTLFLACCSHVDMGGSANGG